MIPRIGVDNAEKENICWACRESNHDSMMIEQLNRQCTACGTTCNSGCCLAVLHRPVFSCFGVLSGNQPRKLTFAEEGDEVKIIENVEIEEGCTEGKIKGVGIEEV